MDPFSRYAIKVSVAQICQIIGWTSIQTSPLEILTDILQEYITGLARLAGRYAMLCKQINLVSFFSEFLLIVSTLEVPLNYCCNYIVQNYNLGKFILLSYFR